MTDTTAANANVTARLVPDTDVATLREALDASIPDLDAVVGGANTVLLLPDTHYPFHFSTGLVTAPAVVRAACRLVRDAGADALVGCTGGAHADPERCGRYLGYERLAADEGAELRHLPVGRDEGESEFPEATVVLNLPTVRPEEDGTVTANLRRAFGSRGETAAPGPIRSVLDGTYSYTGTPQRSLFVAGSDDAGALNRWVVDLLSEPNDAAGADAAPVFESREVSTAGLRSRVGVSPARDLPDALDGVMATGYRLYGRLTGDAVPPQFLREDDDE